MDLWDILLNNRLPENIYKLINCWIKGKKKFKKNPKQ